METNHHAIAVAGFVINDAATELARQLMRQLGNVSRRCRFCKGEAEDFMATMQDLFPIIHAIKYSGVELAEKRQVDLDRLSRFLLDGVEITHKLLASKRWHAYQNFRLAKQLERVQREISRFIRNLPLYIKADVQQMRSEMVARNDIIERSHLRTEPMLWDVRIGTGGLVAEAVRIRQEDEEAWGSGDGVIVALENGKRIVREMLIGRDDQSPQVLGEDRHEGVPTGAVPPEVIRIDEVP